MIVTFEEFRNTEALSFSRLSDFDYSPLYYKTKLESKDKEDAAHFRFGSAVDCLITEPGKFSDKFYVAPDIKTPSDTVVSIIKGVFQDLEVSEVQVTPFSTMEDFRELFEKHMQYNNYRQTVSPEVAWKKTKEVAEDYFNSMRDSAGKVLIDSLTWENVLKCVDLIKTHEYTSWLLEPPEHIEIITQVPVVFDISKGVHSAYKHKLKALIDFIAIDHERKVIQIIDLKTTGKSVYTFNHSYIKYRYYLQGAVYFEALSYLLRVDTAWYRLAMEGYKLSTPKFLVVEQNPINPPFIYKMSREELELAIEGGGKTGLSRKVRGLKELLDDFNWHKERDSWDYPKSYFYSYDFDNEGDELPHVELNELSLN